MVQIPIRTKLLWGGGGDFIECRRGSPGPLPQEIMKVLLEHMFFAIRLEGPEILVRDPL